MNLTVDDMMDQTGLPLLGLVPEDPAVVLSAAAGKALILNSSGGAAEACLRISRRLRGEPVAAFVPRMAVAGDENRVGQCFRLIKVL